MSGRDQSARKALEAVIDPGKLREYLKDDLDIPQGTLELVVATYLLHRVAAVLGFSRSTPMVGSAPDEIVAQRANAEVKDSVVGDEDQQPPEFEPDPAVFDTRQEPPYW